LSSIATMIRLKPVEVNRSFTLLAALSCLVTAAAIMSFIPAGFSVVGYRQGPSFGEGDGDHEISHKLRDDSIFIGFLIQECDRIVVLHHNNGEVLPPELEHGEVHHVSKTTLRVISDSFSECG